MRLIVLDDVWPAESAFRNRAPSFKEWKVVDFLQCTKVIVKFCVGVVHNARGPVWPVPPRRVPTCRGVAVAVAVVCDAPCGAEWGVGVAGGRRASRQAYQTAVGPAREPEPHWPHSTVYR